MFEHILNWKLRGGSHDFPGPDGGTCVNEAAIVAAGFKYRAVTGARDCPRCFSRPVAAYALVLNDTMPEALRQELLLPFVVRLAGTADTLTIERARASFMCLATFQRLLPLVCPRVLRQQCRRVTSPEDMMRFAQAVDDIESIFIPLADWACEIAHHFERLECNDKFDPTRVAYDTAAVPGDLVWWHPRMQRRFFTIATDILDEASRLGTHAAITPERAARRLSEARRVAGERMDA